MESSLTELSDAELRAWAVLAGMAPEGAEPLRQRCRGDLRDLELVVSRAGEEVRGIWSVQGQGGSVAGFGCLAGGVGDAAQLIEGLETASRRRGWTELVFRVPEGFGDALAPTLVARGWRHRGLRLEWAHPVALLPDDPGTPLRWQPADRLPATEVEALLGVVVQTDPLRPLRGQPAEWLRGWMDAPGLKGALWVGSVGERPVALTGAQCGQHGWCRIPYNGLLPEIRGKGYGKWVLRRGFRLMRVLGGRTWHGGCAHDNLPVLRLLQTLGVTPSLRIQEWLLWVES